MDTIELTCFLIVGLLQFNLCQGKLYQVKVIVYCIVKVNQVCVYIFSVASYQN